MYACVCVDNGHLLCACAQSSNLTNVLLPNINSATRASIIKFISKVVISFITFALWQPKDVCGCSAGEFILVHGYECVCNECVCEQNDIWVCLFKVLGGRWVVTTHLHTISKPFVEGNGWVCVCVLNRGLKAVFAYISKMELRQINSVPYSVG